MSVRGGMKLFGMISMFLVVVFNAQLLKADGGYDEELYYEDFDIQVRLARKHPVLFSDHIGVVKRLHHNSMSAAQYKRY